MMPRQVAAPIDPADVLDRSPIGPLQIRVFALCMICLIMDGFDVQTLGYTAPAIVREFGVDRSQLGAVFSAGNFGVLLGSLTFSPLADRVGRRPVLVTMTLFFSVMTFVTSQAHDLSQLLWLRLISGLGLGAIMPNATALIGEFSPARKRVALMMCITVGFTAGAAFGGGIAALLMPAFGWRSVFYFGAVVPFVIGIAMLAALPESLQFLVVRGRHLDRVRRSLKTIDPQLTLDENTTLASKERGRGGAPFRHLFREGRSAATLLLWVANFMNLLNLYALSNWLATVVDGMGYSTQTSVLVSTTLQVGGTVGTFGLAWAIARAGFMPTLIGTFALATLAIAAIGQPAISLTVLFVVVFVAGWCVVGGQPGLNALEATYYPTSLRATGVGWALGVGRAGAIVGPYIGGVLLGNHWSTEQLFLAAAVPALISTIVMIALRFLIVES